MFTREGPTRNVRRNTLLVGVLAFVAGYVNSGGFVLIGSFTSHVTGSVGRLGTNLAAGDAGAAIFALLLVGMFFAGAFVSSIILESAPAKQRARAYGLALLIEAGLLLTFISIAGLSRATHPRLLDAEAALLCLAMGMQNSLLTRLSGAVVRTTHLTGVVTDLGIEAARWFRWRRHQGTVEKPTLATALLLVTIIGSFTTGALFGAVLTERASRWAMAAPAFIVVLTALVALRARKTVTHAAAVQQG